MEFVTADLHFGHKNIIRFSNRPFNSVPEMDQALVDEWNSKVSDKDTVYFLGDMRFSTFDTRVLNGNIIWVKGNHDSTKKNLDPRADKMHQIYNLRRNSEYIVMCHFPIEEWDRCHHGSIHLHGHTHGNSRAMKNRLDVGWDAHQRILTLDEAIDLAKKVQGASPSHHYR